MGRRCLWSKAIKQHLASMLCASERRPLPGSASTQRQWESCKNKLSKFTESVPAGSFQEPSLGPPIPSMLDAIEAHAPDFAVEGRRLYQTVKVMHSFVHGGVHLVAHALRGYPSEKLIDVLRNRNLLSLTLCNVIVVASGRQELAGTVRRLSAAHASVMPPPASTV